MNRQQRRAITTDHERIDVTGIVVHFANGQYVNLDITKVNVVDKDTGRPLFDEVLDAQPGSAYASSAPRNMGVPKDILKRAAEADGHYEEVFNTASGRFVYVQEGDWSGVRPARNDE